MTERRKHRGGLVSVTVLSALLVSGCGMLPTSGGGSSTRPSPAPAIGAASFGWEMTAAGIQRASGDGATWKLVTGLPAINYQWGTLASFASTDVAWVCEQGRARGSQPGTVEDIRTSTSPPARCFTTSDVGASWSTGDVPGSGTTVFGRRRDDATIDSLVGVDGHHAWIMLGTVDTFAGGGQERIGRTDLRLLRTADGGAGWSVVREHSVAVDTQWPFPGGDWVTITRSGAVYTSGFSMGIDRSTDGGATWQTLQIPTPPGGNPRIRNFCSVADAGATITVTVRELVNKSFTVFYEVSTDDGVTWRQGAAPPGPPGGGPPATTC